jgi:hypothetical protein
MWLQTSILYTLNIFVFLDNNMRGQQAVTGVINQEQEILLGVFSGYD